MASSLTISGIHAAYGAVRVIDDVTFKVGGGETVVLLGTNGNGKSTLMKCIMGMVRPSAGSIVAEIDGIHHDLVGRTTEEIVDLGIALVPEGRRLFPLLTVEEILTLLMRLNAQGVTIILIEHIMSAVMSFSQRLAVLVSGRKIADGEPNAVMRDPEVERAYLGQ